MKADVHRARRRAALIRREADSFRIWRATGGRTENFDVPEIMALTGLTLNRVKTICYQRDWPTAESLEDPVQPVDQMVRPAAPQTLIFSPWGASA